MPLQTVGGCKAGGLGSRDGRRRPPWGPSSTRATTSPSPSPSTGAVPPSLPRSSGALLPPLSIHGASLNTTKASTLTHTPPNHSDAQTRDAVSRPLKYWGGIPRVLARRLLEPSKWDPFAPPRLPPAAVSALGSNLFYRSVSGPRCARTAHRVSDSCRQPSRLFFLASQPGRCGRKSSW